MTDQPKTWGPVERETLISACRTISEQTHKGLGNMDADARMHSLFQELVALRRESLSLDTPEARQRIFDIVYPEEG